MPIYSGYFVLFMTPRASIRFCLFIFIFIFLCLADAQSACLVGW